MGHFAFELALIHWSNRLDTYQISNCLIDYYLINLYKLDNSLTKTCCQAPN
jgi:hypothetical protein